MSAGYGCSSLDDVCTSINFDGTHKDEALRIVEGRAPSTLKVFAPMGIEPAGPGCSIVDATEVSCRLDRRLSSFVAMGDGDDIVRMEISTKKIKRIFVLGGGDDDVLVGTRSADQYIGGNGGADVIRGRGGSDNMDGGGGRDLINAVDGRADFKIDCGPGRDTAKIDPEDPQPLNCERIKIRRP